MLADKTKKNTRQIDVFMYVTCLEQQSFCHALHKNLKLLYFQNKECYPAENKQADGNLYFLLCDEDKNPKLCLVMNFSFYDVMWKPTILSIKHLLKFNHLLAVPMRVLLLCYIPIKWPLSNMRRVSKLLREGEYPDQDPLGGSGTLPRLLSPLQTKMVGVWIEAYESQKSHGKIGDCGQSI